MGEDTKCFYLSFCNHHLAEGSEQRRQAGQELAKIQVCESH